MVNHAFKHIYIELTYASRPLRGDVARGNPLIFHKLHRRFRYQKKIEIKVIIRICFDRFIPIDGRDINNSYYTAKKDFQRSYFMCRFCFEKMLSAGYFLI